MGYSERLTTANSDRGELCVPQSSMRSDLRGSTPLVPLSMHRHVVYHEGGLIQLIDCVVHLLDGLCTAKYIFRP